MGLAYNTYLDSNKIYGCKNCKAHLANHDEIISRVSLDIFSDPPSPTLTPSGRSFRPAGVTPTPFVSLINPALSHSNSRSLAAAALSRPRANASLVPRKQNFRGQHGKAYLFNSVVNIEQGEPSERSMTTGRHIVRDINCKQCKETVGWKYDKAYESSEKYKEGKYILEAELLCNQQQQHDGNSTTSAEDGPELLLSEEGPVGDFGRGDVIARDDAFRREDDDQAASSGLPANGADPVARILIFEILNWIARQPR
ncbi:putative Yippee-like protein [Seiridium cardinale]